jgi:hypothetical protein
MKYIIKKNINLFGKPNVIKFGYDVKINNSKNGFENFDIDNESINLDNLFKKLNEQTISELNKLIGTNISEDTQNRATFYLGQSLYMIGKFEEAIKTFVIVQTDYPNLSKKWIDSALDKI